MSPITTIGIYFILTLKQFCEVGWERAFNTKSSATFHNFDSGFLFEPRFKGLKSSLQQLGKGGEGDFRSLKAEMDVLIICET